MHTIILENYYIDTHKEILQNAQNEKLLIFHKYPKEFQNNDQSLMELGRQWTWIFESKAEQM